MLFVSVKMLSKLRPSLDDLLTRKEFLRVECHGCKTESVSTESPKNFTTTITTNNNNV